MTKQINHRAQYAEWAQAIARNWEKKDVYANVSMFSGCHTYLETPFSENAAAVPGGIRNLWNEILLQDRIKVDVELVAAEQDTAVFIYTATFDEKGIEHKSSGIWVVAFEDGECTSFRQWFNVL